MRSARNATAKDFSYLQMKTPSNNSIRFREEECEDTPEPMYPLQVTTLIRNFKHYLTQHELGEVLEYMTVYYVGNVD